MREPWLDPEYERVVLALGENPYAIDYQRLLPSPESRPSILEFGSGCGGLLLPLGRLGYRVSGIDGNARLTRELRQRAKRQGLTISINTRDFRLFRSSARFDCVLLSSLLVNAATDLSEQADLIFRAASHLRLNGRLLIELANPEFFRATGLDEEPQQVIQRSRIIEQSDACIWEGNVQYRLPILKSVIPMRLLLTPREKLSEWLKPKGLKIISTLTLNRAAELICFA